VVKGRNREKKTRGVGWDQFLAGRVSLSGKRTFRQINNKSGCKGKTERLTSKGMLKGETVFPGWGQ